MKTRFSNSPLALASLLLLIPACGGDSEGDAFVDAIPSRESLLLTIDDADDAQALSTDPSTFRARAQEVIDGINAAVSATHARIEELIDGVEPRERTIGERTCKVWETTRDEVDFRLRACEVDRQAKRYSFSLSGRATGTEDAYLPLLGGRGVALPRYEGERRGAGQVAFNFDNLRELTGQGPQGRVGIGYRHAGRARQLRLGLVEFQREGDETPLSARWSFLRVRGLGGVLRHARVADFLLRDEGGALASGTDGVVELGRVALAWNAQGSARVVASACGGTVGEAQCVRVVHCYDASGVASYEDVSGEGAPISWSQVECPAVPLEVVAPPAEGDMTPPSEREGETDAPAMEEPQALPEYE
jgi:hypothetical protein